ncbi:MAG: GH36-type glycosyl hydrolase domain-containing protein, partial [Anaerolineales bacterium]
MTPDMSPLAGNTVREPIREIHRCEPYVYAQMIAGRDAVSHGEAKNSWLTGTAAWNFVAISQWILGIRPDFQGLIVEPSLPEEWQGFKAVRLFRGHRLQITVRRTGPGSSVKVMLDGQEMPSNIIPADLLDGSGGQIDVLVGSNR